MSSSEEQEINTFTKWVNLHLKKRDMQVESIFTDFRDGVKLINLYEQISGFSFDKYNKNPRIKVQSVENLRQVLLKIQEFMESAGLKLQYGAEQLYGEEGGESDRVQILGLLWVLISKYVIADGAEEDSEYKSLKQELLAWCRENTQEYDNVDITNFTTSWQNGLGFCALIHHFLPEKLDYHSLNPENNLENIQLATTTAESIGIDNVLDMEELATAEQVNERSVMTQVALYRQHLKSYADKAKAEKLEKQVREYEYNARSLADALQKQIDDFNGQTFEDKTNKDVELAQNSLFDYRSGARGTLASQKTVLDCDYIQMRKDRAKGNVDAYEPSSEDLSPGNVDNLFAELMNAESGVQQRIRERQNALQETVEAYNNAANEYITYASDKAQNFDAENADGELNEVDERFNAVQEQFEALRGDELSRYATVAFERVTQARDFVHFAITGEYNETLQSVVSLVQNERGSVPDAAPEGEEASAEEGSSNEDTLVG
uniref:Calponin-homology (CH) domain-containing protein n=1 Tax=Percolomonas cosmopolitus TaxID=63605 RepID=A0A7S1PH63_9EUKA|mmetsp:Transcript_757/g.2527  ORF Transcript_757/g.2527 Transcript_757/m.2527 type:complete len:491 (+) Transcript_757:28-1500(+)